MSWASESAHLDSIVRTKRVIVCAGAGGVGKTTTSAALGLAGAMAGRRVLVLTIDPARRLAQAMGIPESGPTPARIDPARIDAAGAPSTGELYAWMLDPQVVFVDMVRRMADSEAHANRILENRIFRALSSVIAGMQEYTAAESLYTLATGGYYDLVVLDTPPSRNALEFLEGPGKLAAFLDKRVIGLFLPGERGGLWQRATKLVDTVFARAFGEGFFRDLQEFLGLFSGMFAGMREHAGRVRDLLRSDQASFILVTSPEAAAIAEVAFLHQRISALDLPLGGYVLNRSWAYTRGYHHPASLEITEDDGPAAARARDKLVALAQEEEVRALRDRGLLADLRARTTSGFALASPHLGEGIEDLPGLVDLARCLVAPSTARG